MAPKGGAEGPHIGENMERTQTRPPSRIFAPPHRDAMRCAWRSHAQGEREGGREQGETDEDDTGVGGRDDYDSHTHPPPHPHPHPHPPPQPGIR